MDGVILDSMPRHADAWIRVFRQYGVDLAPLDIYRREGMSGRDSVIDIFRERNVAYPGDDEYGRILEKKISIFERQPVGLFPLVKEILHFLRERRIALALVTGSLRRSVERALPRDVMDCFDAVVTADDVSRGKPDPEPYATALRLAGGGVHESLAVENAPMGIRSAVGAGIQCIALATSLPEEHLREASLVLQDHRELMEYLQDRL
ncbi:MAG: HAD family phosphatase [Spirochaetes bacterium]|nr:HAD family phosphatase [Spirochaetota bacterium]